MIVSAVVAIAENNAIGKDNQLLWHIPADLKHFKKITSGGTVIMGRKTYDSIGRALPNRRNIVISRNASFHAENTELVTGIREALALAASEEEIFIIGGAQIYQESLTFTDRIYLTRVHQAYQADSFFPEIDPALWLESDVERHPADEKNPIGYTFSTLTRR